MMTTGHFKPAVALLRRLVFNRKGNVSAIVALSLPALMLVLGGSIDAGVAYNARSKLQSAADAAVLAAASSGSTDFAFLSDLADQYFQANSADQTNINGLSGQLSESGDGLRYSVSGQVETAFLKMIGKTEIDLEISAQANRETTGAEIVMVLDTTGSMGFGSSWPDAKSAMHQMLQSLDDLSLGNDFFATLVPMADRINVGTDKTAWMSVDPAPADWEGCFEPREESHPGFPYALSDQPPSLLPFVPTAEGYHISGLADRSFFTCPAEILGPTDDVASIQSAVESLALRGTGRFDSGMAWAWRLLSPQWQGHWSVEGYPSEYGERRKVVVLITDKYTVAYDYEVGGSDGISFGYNQGSQWGFEHLAHVCDQMKTAGIEIHAVYVNGNTHGVSYMEQCATDESHYHEVTNIATLQTTLGKIASDLVRVWLTN
jgi:Flp pilus assembly protein TadG